MARSKSGESILTRVMRILESFGPASPELTISQLAERADLPLSTAHRLVHDMVNHGMLDRHDSGNFRMGTEMWELATRCSRVGLREASAPVLESLHVVVRQHVQLAVLVDGQILFIERLSSRGAVPNIAKIATRLPPYACSAGLVFLAFGPDDLRADVLAGEFTQFTPRSITDATRLRRVLAATRRNGYGVASELINVGSKGLAVPVHGADGEVVAALSIVIQHDADHQPWVPMLKAASRSISQSLGAPSLGDDDVHRIHNFQNPGYAPFH
jgi:DNA-binding IclR family transcriptional regulator